MAHQRGSTTTDFALVQFDVSKMGASPDGSSHDEQVAHVLLLDWRQGESGAQEESLRRRARALPWRWKGLTARAKIVGLPRMVRVDDAQQQIRSSSSLVEASEWQTAEATHHAKTGLSILARNRRGESAMPSSSKHPKPGSLSYAQRAFTWLPHTDGQRISQYKSSLHWEPMPTNTKHAILHLHLCSLVVIAPAPPAGNGRPG